jgi:phosphopantothenoylcysteine decarboxylase/phosphopantothenate--cysteine ligase
MAEPTEIVARVKALLTPQDLAGLRLLVSAGPPRVYLDPVRFISNPSSGRMGYAVAQAGRDRGASVTLVSGPVNLEPPYGVELIGIESALELRQAMLDQAVHADAVVMTAAVADYRPETYASQKVPKGPEGLSLKLIRNPDILAELGQRNPRPILVGFAMETEAGRERALAKVQEKHLDFICLNFPTLEATPFGGDYNQITLVFPDGKIEELSRMSKLAAADVILDNIQKIWINKQ